MSGTTLSIEQGTGRKITNQPLTHANCLAFVQQRPEEGVCELNLSVEGVHCAGCIHKIESTLKQFPEITGARLNFSTRRLKLSWRGTPELAPHYVDSIATLGYVVSGYDPRVLQTQEKEESKFLLQCLGVAGFAAGNIMLLSFALWTTTTPVMGMAMRDFFHLMTALIAIPTVAYAGRPFFRSAYGALSKGRTNMDVPISVGLVLTTSMSIFELYHHAEHVYFDSVVMLAFFLLIGRYFDFLARANARQAATDLLAMMSGTATVIENGQARAVLIRDLQAGMTVSVAMGEVIPADGVVMSGASEIDASLITGETLPQPIKAGDNTFSGTLNLSAPLMIEVKQKAENSLLASIVSLIEKAEQNQALYVRIADRAARLYTPVVHLLALLTFLAWFFIGQIVWQQAMMIAVTVLIITCPCALALAVPVVQVLAVSRLMKRGVMVKAGDVLERLSGIDTVIFDKTGTLTLGKPMLMNTAKIAPHDFKLAASLAAKSNHPLSRALVAAYQGELHDLDVKEIPGHGLVAHFDGREVKLGNRLWCGLGEATGKSAQGLEIVLQVEGAAPVLFILDDQLREDAAAVVSEFMARNCQVYLLSGDRVDAVEAVASKVGITEWHGRMTPEDKFKFLETLKAQGRKVLMVGDGLNDAPVLSAADVSISPSTAINLAQNAAGIIFTGANLQPLLQVLDTARFSQKLVKQNFVMTVLYNLMVIPVAMAGFVTPMIAALAMSTSSLAVITNAFRLRRMV